MKTNLALFLYRLKINFNMRCNLCVYFLARCGHQQYFTGKTEPHNNRDNECTVVYSYSETDCAPQLH
jgi:collagenase-like PrtC family protease